MGPRISLDGMGKILLLPGLELGTLGPPDRSQPLHRLRYPGPSEKNSCPYQDSNSNPSVLQPVPSGYTDCAMPAPGKEW